jgi:polo-like kinase 1
MEDNKNKATIKQDDFIVETPVIIEEVVIKQDKSVVKKYERGKFLGKGGFAKCYEMKCLETGKSYAAKVFEKKNLNNEKSKRKLINEIKLHKKLRHQNIVNFEHFFEDKENVYILLDLCSNQTLNELLKRRKRITELESQCFTIQIAKALKYIHQHKIIHRDLKLGNCFLTSKLELKLGDFGLAAKLEFDDQKRKTVCGTPNYIAPEVLEKKGHSYEVDIWSLGVVLYTLLFGKPPFETNDVKLTYKKIKMNSFTYPENINVHPSAKNLISQILILEPSKRPSFDQILDHEFFKIYNSIPQYLPNSSLICAPNKKFMKHYTKNAEGMNVKSNENLGYLSNTYNNMHNSLNNEFENINNKNIDYIEGNKDYVHRKSESLINMKKQDTIDKVSRNNNSGSNNNAGNTANNNISLKNDQFSTLQDLNYLLNSKEDMNPLSARTSSQNNNNNIINNNYFINFGNLNNLELKFEDNLLLKNDGGKIELRKDESDKENTILLEKLKGLPKINKYIDYTTKFGIIYIIPKMTVGICFEDFSNIVRNYHINTDYYKYLYFDKGGKNKMNFDDSTLEEFYKNKSSNKDIVKKIEVFKQVLSKYSSDIKQTINEREISKIEFNQKSFNNNFVFVKKFFKTQHSILFRLSNKLVQVAFNDKSQLILSTDGSYVIHKTKNNEEFVFSILNVLKSDNQDLIKKIKYTKSLLIYLVKNQKSKK